MKHTPETTTALTRWHIRRSERLPYILANEARRAEHAQRQTHKPAWQTGKKKGKTLPSRQETHPAEFGYR